MYQLDWEVGFDQFPLAQEPWTIYTMTLRPIGTLPIGGIRLREKCANGIIHRILKHNDNPIIALVGHSYGGLRNKQIAKRIDDKTGRHVHYIAGIDPTAGHIMEIPRNVGYVDEFWATGGVVNFPRFARWRSGYNGTAGGMYLYPYGTKHKIHEIKTGHVPIAKHKNVVETTLNKIKEITGG